MGPEKFPAVLKLPYIGEASRRFEVKVKELIKENYNQISPRIIFLSKPVIKVQLKDLITNQDKSCIVYKFNCFCDKSYIGQTSRLNILNKVFKNMSYTVVCFGHNL